MIARELVVPWSSETRYCFIMVTSLIENKFE